MSEVLVVGAGAVGLVTALHLHRDHDVTVVDAGPPPSVDGHGVGATHSGCDARHITRTETTTWTSAARSELILRASAERGWDGRPPDGAGAVDRWIERFQQQAASPEANRDSRRSVLDVNTVGLELWEEMITGDDPLFRGAEVPTGGWIPIFFTDSSAAAADLAIERSLDDRVSSYDLHASRNVARLLGPGVVAGIEVPGRALRVRTLCRSIVDRLHAEGSRLLFGTLLEPGSMPEADAVIWATPFLPGSVPVLPFELGGVVGVWLQTETKVGPTAFKIVGPEPTNYINVTIDDGLAMASGGYSYVAGHGSDELAMTVQVLIEQLRETLTTHVPSIDWSQASPASCIRPSTPTGVPLAERLVGRRRPEFVIGAGCAGGFTQAPAQARWVARELASALG